MTPAERVAIREAIAKLEEALAADEQAPIVTGLSGEQVVLRDCGRLWWQAGCGRCKKCLVLP